MVSRIKFQIQNLFKDIYNNHIPEYLFQSDVTTFADLQSAGLQSIIPIVDKLRENGHSDDNIRTRVFAFMENEVYLNYVIGKYPNIPVTFDIYRDTNDMKFDVIVGNPPYQGKNKQDKLWVKFFIKSLQMNKEGGYVVMITPNSWTKRPESKSFIRITNIIKKKQILSIKMDVSSFFEGVGEKIGYQIINNVEKFTETKVEINDGTTLMIDYSGQKIIGDQSERVIFNIFDKIEKSEHPRISQYFSKRDASYDKRSLVKGKFKLTSVDDFNVPLLYTLNKIYYVQNNQYTLGIKFFLNFSGYFYKSDDPTKYMPILEGYISGQATFSIDVSTYTEGMILRNNYSRKLMRFYNDKFKTGGFNTGIPNLPWIGYDHNLSDTDLYTQFNLTQEEIQIVESEYND